VEELMSPRFDGRLVSTAPASDRACAVYAGLCRVGQHSIETGRCIPRRDENNTAFRDP
jgi:hypothetical protein